MPIIMDPTYGSEYGSDVWIPMDPASNVVNPRTEGTPMKHLISCSSICVAATLTLGFGGLAGCEDSETSDVSGHIRQHDDNTPKIDPNAMPGGEGDGLQSQDGG